MDVSYDSILLLFIFSIFPTFFEIVLDNLSVSSISSWSLETGVFNLSIFFLKEIDFLISMHSSGLPALAIMAIPSPLDLTSVFKSLEKSSLLGSILSNRSLNLKDLLPTPPFIFSRISKSSISPSISIPNFS
eukprot:jgi/Orpsp1_1/1189092/evm.model.d7180000069442.1